jgi:protease-4
MALDADYLVDRNRLKRRLAVWRAIAVVVAVTLVVVAAGRFVGVAQRSHIAVLDVEDVIVNDLDRLTALEDAADDSSIKALIVYINSPGGTVVGGENLYHALRAVAAKKPVVAVMGDLATSAGYMVAVATEHILAREGTITGSIGVLLQTAEFTDLLSKLGISVDAIKSAPLKAEPSPLSKLSPEVRRATQTLVDDMFDMFLDMVADNRKLTKDEVRALADGRVFTGRMAVKNGLIDAIGGEKEAIAWLAANKGIDADLPVRSLRIRREVGDWLEEFSSMARKTVFSERLKLDGLVSVWHPRLD